MQMLKGLIALAICTFSIGSWARADFHSVLSYNFGMSNFSVTENEAAIEQTDDSVASGTEESAESSSVSSMAFQLSWEFGHDGSMAYFLDAQAPLMGGSGAAVYNTKIGFNMYLNDLGSKFSMNQSGTTVVIIPTLKYYWGASVGGGYVVYLTESQKKGDIYFGLGLHGGMVYSIGDTWGIKAEAGITRATGIETSGMKMDVMLGATYYL
ncbi:MAG: hypothetical protein CME63_10190 [Halobacteriovoraceae bacterium]|nr:hypothetical protein [Halobacteriovoraceae bacterium]|tara:strand:+ start:32954 stop:33583 length:630 start_codon:yes stop_codon:yes gene_type:complete